MSILNTGNAEGAKEQNPRSKWTFLVSPQRDCFILRKTMVLALTTDVMLTCVVSLTL